MPDQKISVLFVDDEELVREMTAMMLEDNDCKVYTAETGSEALKTFKKNKAEIDVAVLDFSMPEMTGYDLAQYLRAMKPSLGIVIISGLNTTAEVRSMQTSGGVEFVSKPFESKTLMRAVQNALQWTGQA